jgi:hypothetical protein
MHPHIPCEIVPQKCFFPNYAGAFYLETRLFKEIKLTRRVPYRETRLSSRHEPAFTGLKAYHYMIGQLNLFRLI